MITFVNTARTVMPERTSRKAQENGASAELALIAAVILAGIAAVVFAAAQFYAAV